jgi:hypothetical protein
MDATKEQIVKFELRLPQSQAQALAQFANRLCFSDLREKSQNEGEAYMMRDAIDGVGSALADAGYSPR